jgi:glycosyltransferase involved in cell wall biosynthesis
MKVLLLAPHPFYQDRGTPIAVRLLAAALSERGDVVDIVTYHEGEDPDLPAGVRVHRIAPPPLAHNIQPGFSLKKVISDISMRRLVKEMAAFSPDVIHAVEESVFMARSLWRQFGIPYVYDLDSSMPRQIVDKFPLARPLLPIMAHLESEAIRDAIHVVPMCDSLGTFAKEAGATHVTTLHDISLLDLDSPKQDLSPARIRERCNATGPLALYVGNLVAYQGIDLLLDSLCIARQRCPDLQLAVVGGAATDIKRYRRKAASLHLTAAVHFLGPEPITRMQACFAEADVLVSPRIAGENTPMKIYSYLASGKPVVATDLPTHTQVMNRSVGFLADATPADFADALLTAVTHTDQAKERSEAARQLIDQYYSERAYKDKVRQIYRQVERDIAAGKAETK